ncbi:acetate kinase [Ancylomarina euxinus]|uniref:Acetate kinase n=1 Tax=Ancylomarina euxinus TaxID=2283627 RepID=A0A425Y1N5_9BACT|nr:acetate kinase [Ancylomarina euxinus]MCZ4695094.1 acetate kinase [Ancylomarina euxinus]MUP14970.1 acetate/propionate family kinase [Ancylomarina euxinus]RRG21860.1 acetate kinase [Ancylomarina euxinus]
MNVLVLNCGSSSLKYQILNMGEEATLLASGLVERIGLENGVLTHKPEGKDKFKTVQDIPNHSVGINLVLAALVDADHGVISDIKEINAAGHRVAHGGEYFQDSAFITEEAKANIKACCELAPLHNPANLEGILAIEKLLPGLPQVAVFDTSFHQTLPKEAFMYGLPYDCYETLKVRKYGFHGTSHKFVANKACEILGWNIEDKKIVSCHLGNGASVCAIDGGKSIETSMGFTPNEGLLMGTRTGNLDLGALLYIAEKKDLSIQETNNLINKESGLAGISGISSDMRDLEDAAAEGNERAQLALDMFAYRVKRFVGSYTASMGGVDLVLFTGGIGENDAVSREKIAGNFGYFGLDFDFEKNKGLRGKDAIISTEDSKVKCMIVTTNEELVIAKDTQRIVTAL